jgi:succinate dehydrogenase / fumarate reductase membrane anchor subunit
VTHHPHGLRPWLLQRISAVYLGVFLVYVMVSLVTCGELDYVKWHGWLTHPVMSIATAGFIFALLIHGWVGMRDIILDYVSHIGVRLLLLTGVGLLLAASGIWSLQILIRAVVQ